MRNIPEQFSHRICQFIYKHNMISSKETVIVAVSGGPDSLALLHSLNNLKNQLGCHLHIAHLNHGLRPNAVEDTNYVCQQARILNLSVTVRTISLSSASEASARQARYQFLEQDFYLLCQLVNHHLIQLLVEMIYTLLQSLLLNLLTQLLHLPYIYQV